MRNIYKAIVIIIVMDIKKLFIMLSAAAVIVACNPTHKSKVSKDIQEYAVVKIATPDLSDISDNGKEVLNLYKFAADQVDEIYWKQYFGDKSLMENLPNADQKEYAMINYGPWDRINAQPFVEGYGPRPAGVNFYPADMTDAEFQAFDDPDKNSPYTLIRRNEDGSLKTVWYHDEYSENIEKIAVRLAAAADITIKPSVKNYLLKKIEALRTDNYYESDLAWLDMDDSKMDLVIGPNQTDDDQLYGKKTSYEAFVLLKDLDRTELLKKYVGMLPELQQSLPCPAEYKTFEPGLSSNIFCCDALYYAGQANAGVKVIAINLPYDPKVQAEKGTRTILLRNVLMEKFNRIIRPSANVLFDKDGAANVDPEAFYWNVAFREVAHGLGVKETVNGKGSVSDALGASALTWEKAKAYALGEYLVLKMVDKHNLSWLATKENALTTFFISLVRSERFGEESALGKSNIMIYNYLAEQGAFKRGNNGHYSINFKKMEESIEQLASLILKTQATGDVAFAKEFEDKYSKTTANYKADNMNLRLEHVPIDVRFEYDR